MSTKIARNDKSQQTIGTKDIKKVSVEKRRSATKLVKAKRPITMYLRQAVLMC